MKVGKENKGRDISLGKNMQCDLIGKAVCRLYLGKESN